MGTAPREDGAEGPGRKFFAEALSQQAVHPVVRVLQPAHPIQR